MQKQGNRLHATDGRLGIENSYFQAVDRSNASWAGSGNGKLLSLSGSKCFGRRR